MERLNTRKELLKKKYESDIFNIKKTLIDKANIIESKYKENNKKNNIPSNKISSKSSINNIENKDKKSFKILNTIKLIDENNYDTSNIKNFSKDYYKDPNNQNYSNFFRKRMNSSNFEFNLKSERKNVLKSQNATTFTPKYKNFNPSNLKSREFSTTLSNSYLKEPNLKDLKDLNLSLDNFQIDKKDNDKGKCENVAKLNSFYNSYIKNSNNIRGFFNSEQKYINKEHYNYHSPNLTAFQRKFAQDYSNCDFVKVDINNIKKDKVNSRNNSDLKSNYFNQTFSIFKTENQISNKKIDNNQTEMKTSKKYKNTFFDCLGSNNKIFKVDTTKNKTKNEKENKNNASFMNKTFNNCNNVTSKGKRKEKLLQINNQTNQIFSTFVDKDFKENEIIKTQIKNEINKKFNSGVVSSSKANKQYDLSSINQNPNIFNTSCKQFLK